MIIPNYIPFEGEHCETVAVGNLLKHRGIALSEPMLFGIGAGLGFIYWAMKNMPLPFLGGRSKVLASTIFEHLNIRIDERQTSSPAKAWANVVEPLDRGEPVALQLDCYHLPYFTQKIHFAGHHVAMYGYDATTAYLVDTRPQGSAQTSSLNQLANARSEKGPMSARNRSYTISAVPETLDLEAAIVRGIRGNAETFLHPPIQNLGYKGIKKASSEIRKWFTTSRDVKNDFHHAAAMMEHAGTGGALFRNLYRDFLKEAAERLESDGLREGHERFARIAATWTEVANLLSQVAETESAEPLNAASDLLLELSELEQVAMQQLLETVLELKHP